MQISVDKLKGLQRKITVVVPAEDVQNDIEKRLKEIAKQAKLPGFRPGKVPMSEVKKRFSASVRGEVVGEMMQKSFSEAAEKENMHPVGQPKVDHKDQDDGGFEFTATFEVLPEITLTSFEKVKVAKKIPEIADEDIDSMVERMREQHAEYVEVERATKDKDKVMIDFEGFMDGKVFEKGSAKDMPLVLGSKQFIEGFESGLLKKKPGAKTTLKLNFPEAYHDKSIAGKPVEFKVTINKVMEPKLPEIDDKFAEVMGVKEGGLEKLKENIREQLVKDGERRANDQVKKEVMDKLGDLHSFDLPEALLEKELELVKKQALQSGEKQSDKELQKTAKQRVQLGLVMSEIIKQNDLKPDVNKMRQLIADMAGAYQQPEEIMKWYSEDPSRMAGIEAMVMEDQVVETVLSGATITEKKISYKKLMEEK